MIGAAAYDHTVNVWRSTESQSAKLRVKERSWSKVAGASGIRMSVQTKRETRDDPGGGEKTLGEYAAYGPAGIDVKEGDVLEVYEGPEAPVNLEVDSADRPRSHHTQLVLIAWNGSLS